MNEKRIDKKAKLRLNKQTVAHLNSRQMSRVGSGNIAAVNEQSIIICNKRETEQNTQSIEVCPNGPTHDTGIPPSGQTRSA